MQSLQWTHGLVSPTRSHIQSPKTARVCFSSPLEVFFEDGDWWLFWCWCFWCCSINFWCQLWFWWSCVTWLKTVPRSPLVMIKIECLASARSSDPIIPWKNPWIIPTRLSLPKGPSIFQSQHLSLPEKLAARVWRFEIGRRRYVALEVHPPLPLISDHYHKTWHETWGPKIPGPHHSGHGNMVEILLMGYNIFFVISWHWPGQGQTPLLACWQDGSQVPYWKTSLLLKYVFGDNTWPLSQSCFIESSDTLQIGDKV